MYHNIHVFLNWPNASMLLYFITPFACLYFFTIYFMSTISKFKSTHLLIIWLINKILLIYIVEMNNISFSISIKMSYLLNIFHPKSYLLKWVIFYVTLQLSIKKLTLVIILFYKISIYVKKNNEYNILFFKWYYYYYFLKNGKTKIHS